MIHAHTHQASRHLPDVSRARCKETQVWTAKAHWDTERLSLTGHNVGRSAFNGVFSRRSENSQRHSLAYVHDRQCLEFVRQLGNVMRLLDGSKEIRRLNNDSGNIASDRARKFILIDAAIGGVLDQVQ